VAVSQSYGAWRMCGRKRRYSKRAAMKVASHLNGRQDKRVHAYRCPICDCWHVGGVGE
jgi:hypothetical protein